VTIISLSPSLFPFPRNFNGLIGGCSRPPRNAESSRRKNYRRTPRGSRFVRGGCGVDLRINRGSATARIWKRGIFSVKRMSRVKLCSRQTEDLSRDYNTERKISWNRRAAQLLNNDRFVERKGSGRMCTWQFREINHHLLAFCSAAQRARCYHLVINSGSYDVTRSMQIYGSNRDGSIPPLRPLE
jgi:hypothetical protein